MLNRRSFVGGVSALFASLPLCKVVSAGCRRDVVYGGCRSGKSTLGHRFVTTGGIKNYVMGMDERHLDYLCGQFCLSDVTRLSSKRIHDYIADDGVFGDRLWIDASIMSVGDDSLFELSKKFKHSLWTTFPVHRVTQDKFFIEADSRVRLPSDREMHYLDSRYSALSI